MSREHPMGVYVAADMPSPTQAPPAQAASTQDRDRSWQTSSFDLLDGLQISESPLGGLSDAGCDGASDGGGDDPGKPAA